VLDAETIPFVDVSAARMLDELADELKRDGMSLLLARDVGQVRDVLRTAGGDMSQEHVYPTVHAAVEASLSKR
jgi:SulP family sulfate permease